MNRFNDQYACGWDYRRSKNKKWFQFLSTDIDSQGQGKSQGAYKSQRIEWSDFRVTEPLLSKINIQDQYKGNMDQAQAEFQKKEQVYVSG